MKKKGLLLAFALILTLGLLAGCGDKDKKSEEEIKLATTTSTKDSGLLDELLPAFTEKTGIKVDVISVGSGEAMALGEKGEADVLLVHSPAAEKEFVEAGHADKDGRLEVMYNDFVIIGPKDDPAKIKETNNDAKAAFKRIKDSNTVFISRADESGTHKKELSIWEAIKVDPKGDNYVEAGDGMGAIINMANERNGYTIADRATWMNVGKDTDLQIVSEKDASKILDNQYAVICVNPEKNDKIKADEAKKFQEWIVSKEAQDLIGKFGMEEYKISLFTPNAKDAK